MKSKKTLNMRALSALLASTLAISAVFAPTAFAQDIGDTSQIATAEESSDFTPADAINDTDIQKITEKKSVLDESDIIRTVWNEEKEDWYFSIVDVIAVLTEQPDQRAASNYWAKLKQRLKEEGADQLLTNCQQLKLKSPKDGKRYKTDVADTERLLRIIQSIPSPKAEPFKRWLAEVGRERIEETIAPELTIDRALETYLKKDTPANGLTNACRRSKSAKS